MKKTLTPLFLAIACLFSAMASAQEPAPTRSIAQTFTIPAPNYKLSPYPVRAG